MMCVMAKIRIDAADGLSVQDVLHARFSALPATATIADVRDYFAASTSRRLAFVADGDVYVGSLTPAHVADGDPGRLAAEVADAGPTVGPGEPAATGRDLALRTDARRVPVVDDDGRLLGVVAVTGDLLSFCGTSDATSAAGRPATG
jgi:CBS domain-containing protein